LVHQQELEKQEKASLGVRRGHKVVVRKTHPTEDFPEQELGNQTRKRIV
jgi:hypothetical protein